MQRGEDRRLPDQAHQDHPGRPAGGRGRLRGGGASGCATGELVGVYPEATISRSFELKEFKTGAARMAIEAQVPIIPLIVWGAHRHVDQGPSEASWAATKIPITVAVGEPVRPAGHRRADRWRDCARR